MCQAGMVRASCEPEEAHEVLLPTRDSYGFCFHMKPCEGDVADVRLQAINNFHL